MVQMSNKFLNNLSNEGKLEVVEPSDNICESYLGKADNCFKSAKILMVNRLFENSVSMSYYSMYDSLLALLFKTGIKCENHSASILLLKIVFEKLDLFEIISKAKEERIDKQYYVTDEKEELTKEISEEMVKNAESFLLNMKLFIKNQNSENIEKIQNKLKELIL
jgi:uncharacterized protein (UPF0332 family)